MRARKKDQKNLVKAGTFISCLVFLLMVGIISIGKETSLFESKTVIRARVPNVSNLKTGSYVELKGIRIGAVSGIDIVSEDEVEIQMTILENQLKWIKKDSKVSISTAGLVGDKFVEIYKGSTDAKQLRPEKDILRSEKLTDIKSIMDKGENIAQVTERMLLRLDRILEKIDNDNLIVETMMSMNRASINLEQVTKEMKDAKTGQMVRNVNNSMASLERILNRIEKGPGTVNSLIYDEGVYDDIRVLLGGAQRNKVIKYFIRESIKKSEEKKPQD